MPKPCTRCVILYLMKRVCVVVPAYNEAAVIAEVVRGSTKVFAKTKGFAVDVVVINDASKDATAAEAAKAKAIVINHILNSGAGGATLTGLTYARQNDYDIVATMDADGQHDPADIPRLLDQLNQGHDMVVGARQKGSQASVGRGLANGLYNRLASWMTGHKVEDLTSGFRAVRADKFREFLYLLPNGFSYPTTSTMAFFRAGYSVAYIPIHAAKRIGKSHIRLLRDGARFLLIIFKIGTLFSPLKIFAPVALVMFLLGTGWYGWTFFTLHRFTNMSALLYTGSVMTFMMGLISEQITALMYKDAK